MVRTTNLMLVSRDAAGGVQTAGFEVIGFPSQVILRVETYDETGRATAAEQFTIPIKIVDALGTPLETGLPVIKRSFVAPTPEEMAAAAGGLAELERRLEDED